MYFLPICFQFVDSSEGLGCTQCPEGWKLERWLLLNPNKHEVHRTLLIWNCGIRRARTWVMTQERVTVNVSERHYSLLKDKIVTEYGSSRLDLYYTTCFNLNSNTKLSWQYSEYQLLIMKLIFLCEMCVFCFVLFLITYLG